MDQSFQLLRRRVPITLPARVRASVNLTLLMVFGALGLGFFSAYVIVEGQWYLAVGLILAIPGLVLLHNYPVAGRAIWRLAVTVISTVWGWMTGLARVVWQWASVVSRAVWSLSVIVINIVSDWVVGLTRLVWKWAKLVATTTLTSAMAVIRLALVRLGRLTRSIRDEARLVKKTVRAQAIGVLRGTRRWISETSVGALP